MKTISNKKTQIIISKEGEKEEFLDYKGICLICLNVPISKGLGMTEMRQNVTTGKKIQDSKDKIKLEDAEFEYLKKCIDQKEDWTISHEDIVEFYNYINSIE